MSIVPSNGTTTSEIEKLTITINATDLLKGSYPGNLYVNSTGGNLIGAISFEITIYCLGHRKKIYKKNIS
jgi:hypothetical protein